MNIKELRNKVGYTQEDIARLLDITLYYYQRIESGKSLPNIKIGLKLSKILKVDPFKLWLKD